MKDEPIYQIQHERFILSFYPDDLEDRAAIRRAVEDRIRSAYRFRHIEPPNTLSGDVERIAKIVARDMEIKRLIPPLWVYVALKIHCLTVVFKMTRPEDFPTDRLHEIADDVVDLFRNEEQLPDDVLVELGDGIPMWGIGLTALHTFDLGRLAEPITYFKERWAHPIKCMGKAVAYAETEFVHGTDQIYVPTMTWGGVCNVIAGAIDDADDDTKVRLVIDPSLHLQAVWLWTPSERDAEIRLVGEGYSTIRIGENDLLTWLRQQVPVSDDDESRIMN